MKAISIRQPWASLIVEGIKDIENRTWPCPEKYIGKRILIHASKTFEKNGWSVLKGGQVTEVLNSNLRHITVDKLPIGAILGSVEIVASTINEPSAWAEKTEVSTDDDGFPKYDRIIYNWMLANPVKFEKPIPAKGKLSFWDFDLKFEDNEPR